MSKLEVEGVGASSSSGPARSLSTRTLDGTAPRGLKRMNSKTSVEGTGIGEGQEQLAEAQTPRSMRRLSSKTSLGEGGDHSLQPNGVKRCRIRAKSKIGSVWSGYQTAQVDALGRDMATSMAKASGAWPKAPKKAYTIFADQQKKKRSDIKPAELGARWKKLAATDRDEYRTSEQADGVRYADEVANFQKSDAFATILRDAKKLAERKVKGEAVSTISAWLKEQRLEAVNEKKAEAARNRLAMQLARGVGSAGGFPTAPSSAYALFFAAKKSDFEGTKALELSKKVAAAWKTLTDSKKAEYVKEASARQAEYQTALEEFRNTDAFKAAQADADTFLRENAEKRSRGEEPQIVATWQKKRRLEAIAKAKAEKKSKGLVLKLVRSCLRSAGAPATPKAGYQFFSESVREEVAAEGGSFSEVAKKIAAKWKEATEEDKKKFQDQAAEDSKRYIAELETFCASDDYRAFADDVDKWKSEVADEKAHPFRKWYYAKKKERAKQQRAEDRKQALEDRRNAKLEAKGGKKAKAAKPAKVIVPKGTISMLPPLDVDPLWDTVDDDTEFDPADVLLNDRRINAAAKRGAVKFIRRAMEDLRCSSSLFRRQSTNVELTSLHHALLRKDLEMLKVLAAELEPRKPPEGYQPQMGPLVLTRQQLSRCELQPMSTGFARGRAFRAKKLRKVNQGRGGKEGLQAFVHDLQGRDYYNPDCSFEDVFSWAATQGLDLQTMSVCLEIFGGVEKTGIQLVLFLSVAVRSGQLELARELVKQFGPPNDMHGLNANHVLALQAAATDQELKEAVKRKASVTKKAFDNNSITPVHCACINPDKRALDAFLSVLGAGAQAEDLVKDDDNRTLLHYAAACETADNLMLLLSRGYSPHRVSSTNLTPLMIACITNRPECVSRLLDAAADALQRGEDEKTSFHMAVQHNAFEALEALVTYKGSDEDKPLCWDRALTSSQRSALHEACAVGNLAMVELLIAASPKSLNKGDKQNCTPLIYAVMNGHTKLASALLAKNAIVDTPDTSNSTPLHYALAYGWRDAAKLLVDRGHDTNVQNDWRASPVSVAVMKGHFAQVAWFASTYPIDPNEQDENGRTLLCRACESLTDKQWRFLMHVLVEKRNADVNLPDGQGSLPICLAVKACSADKELLPELEASLKLLCNMRADVGARASGGALDGQSALSIALQGKNQSLLCLMLNSGAGVAVHGRGETLLHLLASSCCSPDGDTLGASVLAVVKGAVPVASLQEMAKTPNARGLLPIHRAVTRFNEVIKQIMDKASAAKTPPPVQRHGFGFGGGFGGFGGGLLGNAPPGLFGQPSQPPTNADNNEERLSTEEKLGRARQQFQDFITWLMTETNATLDAPAMQLEKPWEGLGHDKSDTAPGPMPSLGSDVQIVEEKIMWKLRPDQSVVAAQESQYRSHDVLFGLSTPLILLISGGDEEAVRWFLTTLASKGKKGLQADALKAKNIYGVTPLISALAFVGGPKGMPADTFRTLATTLAVKVRFYQGGTALHMAVAGGSVGWTAHKARTSSAETLLGWVRFRITKIYESVNPAIISEIPNLLEMNKTDLYAFYEKVCKKYNMRVEAKPSLKELCETANQVGQAEAQAVDPEVSAQIMKGFAGWDPSSSSKSLEEMRWEQLGQSTPITFASSTEFASVEPSPGMVAFEAVLACALEAGVVNAKDGDGLSPLHLAVTKGPVEVPVLEPLKDIYDFSVAYANALALESATNQVVKETGMRKVPPGELLFQGRKKGELLGLPSCRVTFGRWYFEISNLSGLLDGKVGWHTAPRLEGGVVKDVTRATLVGIASISELLKEAKRASVDTIGVALDFDENELCFALDGLWLSKRAVKKGFQDCVCPVVFGIGECTVRIKPETFKHPPYQHADHKSNYWPVSRALPALTSRRRAVQALLLARADIALTAGKMGLTALQIAVDSKADAGTIQLLCDARSDPNALLQKGRAPLLIAAEANDLPLASALVAAKATVDFPDVRASANCPNAELFMQRRHYPHTALHWVAGNSNASAFVELLVKAKADVNAPTERRTVSTRKCWLPLPHAEGDVAEAGSQIDRGLTVNDRVALHTASAIELLAKLGAQPKVLSKAEMEAAKYADDGFAVLRGYIKRIVGESRYQLGGGDFEKILADSEALPLSDQRPLEVSRKMLLWQANVESIRVDLVRPLHLATECNSNDSVRTLLAGRADPAAVDERQGNLALHFAAHHRNLAALEALFKAKTPLDVADQTPDRKTPLRIAVSGALAGHDEGMKTLHAILAARAMVDLPGGSDGRTALHLAASARSLPVITELLQHKANANAQDPSMRTSLHDAIVAAGPFEPSFDVERSLLNASANVNALDRHGRTPLHYAFVKPGSALDVSSADPIETVTSLCAVEGIQVDIVDAFGSSPMLYAARRSCTISSLFLAKRGASLATRDMHGNDILGCALGGKHHEYAITLLSQNAGEVNTPMRHMSESQVCENSVKRRRIEAGPPNSLFFEAVKNSWLGLAYLLLDHGVPFHRAIQDALELGQFRLVLTLLSKVNPAQNEMLRRADDSGRTLVHVLADFPRTLPKEATEIAVELAKLGVPAATYDSSERSPLHCCAIYGHLALMEWLLSAAGVEPCSKKSKDGVVPLHSTCSRSWLTAHGEVNHLAALRLLVPHNRAAANELFPVVLKDDKGNPYTVMNTALVNAAASAFRDSTGMLLNSRAEVNLADGIGETPLCAALRCAGEKAFSLTEVLFSCKADPNKREGNGVSPLCLAVHASAHSEKLVRFLIQAGARVNDDPKLKSGSSVVIEALTLSGSRLKCDILKALLELKASPDQGVDKKGRPPLVLSVDEKQTQEVKILLKAGTNTTCVDKSGRSALLIAVMSHQIDIINSLLGAQADPNNGLDEHGCSALFHAVKWGHEDTVRSLLKSRANTNKAGTDKHGCTPLSLAILSNAGMIADALLDARADPIVADKHGRNAAHHCVQPLAHGSFESTWLAAAIAKAPRGKDAFDAADAKGVRAVDLASMQGSGRLAQALRKVGITVPQANPAAIQALCMVADPVCDKPPVDQHSRIELEHFEATAKTVPIPVHQSYAMSGNNEVWPENDDEYDAMLFKVDLKRDEMRFYHIQLIHEKNKDLFVLFTRWGEIGETGMFQKTPAANKEEALKSFEKVFKEKTGNFFATRATTFERKPGKYQLLKRRRAVATTEELLKPFDPSQLGCSLPLAVRRTVDAICDERKVAQALRNLGINSQNMPFGSLSRETLDAAKELLGEIRKSLEELKAIRAKPHDFTPQVMQDRAKEKNAAREAILELSSRYYELIPRGAGVSEVAKPLENDDRLAKEFQALMDLSEVSLGVQVILGSLHCQQKQHPLEYCYNALQINLEQVDSKSDEFDFLLKYAERTSGGNAPQVAVPDDFNPRKRKSRNGDTITAIYRLARKGEAERFLSGASALPNHRLLWHGSNVSNMIGILSQGLRIAPPEAPASGYMFGKGVYFADMYMKSRGYCRSDTTDATYMILCEVALGNLYPSRQALYMEEPRPGCNSTWGVGANAPDWKNQIVEPGGAGVPSGQPSSQGRDYGLGFNEFIVYDPSQIRMRYLIELNNFECPEETRKRKAQEEQDAKAQLMKKFART